MIRHLEHARAALAAAEAADRPVTVTSAPGAGAYLGAGVFRAIAEAARRDYPKARATFVLDCGAHPGWALNAFRLGIEAVSVTAKPAVRRRLVDIARKSGSRVAAPRGPILDLGDEANPDEACRRWIMACRPTPKKRRRSHG